MKKIKSLIITFTLGLALSTGGLASAAAQAVAPQPQTACPVLAGKINKDIYVDYKGQRIYFCCPGCDAEFKKDPEKYLQKMKEQGVTPEKAPAAK